MSDNFHKNYSGSDIEKYWKGQLTPAEMHAMEKAAMDDPFLADAMEGFKNAPAAAIDLASLRKRLDQRTAPTHQFQWMKIAASVILIAGIAYTSYILSVKQPDNRVSETKTKTQETAPAVDSITPSVANELPAPATTDQTTDNARRTAPVTERSEIADTTVSPSISEQFSNIDRDQAKVTEDQKSNIEGFITAPTTVFNDSVKMMNEIQKNSEYKNDKDLATNKPSAGLNEKAKSRKANPYGELMINNKFMGRVVDANNQPIPFANVTNTRDNVGTYTNMNGEFNLISADSALSLRIKSVGYEPKNFQFSPKQNQAVVILTDDPFTRNDVAQQNISRLKLTPRQQQDTPTEEETEEIAPEVGWDYYNRYIANNIKLPLTRASDLPQDVELSFQVDRFGNPTNIRITRSSKCKECDQAAINVLKDGPKWKRAAKKSRTTITISVDQ